jgi:hypothetical protein
LKQSGGLLRYLCAPRKPDRELDELAGRAVDLDRAAMLLGDDVPADPETQPGPLAGRLGREERLEQAVAEFGRDAVPLPRTLISTASPRSYVVTFSAGRNAASIASRRRLSTA